MTVSWPPEPLLLRASSEPPPRVLKIAQGELLKSTPNPTCCAPSVVKVATKSSDRPAVYVPAVPTRAPSTVILPPLTEALPPLLQLFTVQPLGKVVPENSVPTVGN